MEALDFLKKELKSYYPESAELQLSPAYAGQRRFNFYFSIEDRQRFLLYLNWDGDDRFILKCLEFSDTPTLRKLMEAYYDAGSKSFNAGQPRSAVSFVVHNNAHIRALEFRGVINGDGHPRDLGPDELMRSVAPLI
jgi:hypothetical protein